MSAYPRADALLLNNDIFSEFEDSFSRSFVSADKLLKQSKFDDAERCISDAYGLIQSVEQECRHFPYNLKSKGQSRLDELRNALGALRRATQLAKNEETRIDIDRDQRIAWKQQRKALLGRLAALHDHPVLAVLPLVRRHKADYPGE